MRPFDLSGRVVLIDATQVLAFGGGDRSCPCHVNPRKPDANLTLLIDLRGTQLTLRSAPSNSRDHHEILPRAWERIRVVC